jgi:hypothetical protein
MDGDTPFAIVILEHERVVDVDPGAALSRRNVGHRDVDPILKESYVREVG